MAQFVDMQKQNTLAHPPVAEMRKRGGSVSVPISKLPVELQSMMSAFDLDGDGSLSVDELGLVINNYRKSKKKLRRVVWFVVVLMACFFGLVASNFASGIAIAHMTKVLAVNQDAAGESRLTDTYGKAITTSTHIEEISLTELAKQGPAFDYTGHIKSVVVSSSESSEGAPAHSYQIISSMWTDVDNMELYLTRGMTLSLVEGQIKVFDDSANPTGRALAENRRELDFISYVRVYWIGIY